MMKRKLTVAFGISLLMVLMAAGLVHGIPGLAVMDALWFGGGTSAGHLVDNRSSTDHRKSIEDANPPGNGTNETPVITVEENGTEKEGDGYLISQGGETYRIQPVEGSIPVDVLVSLLKNESR